MLELVDFIANYSNKGGLYVLNSQIIEINNCLFSKHIGSFAGGILYNLFYFYFDNKKNYYITYFFMVKLIYILIINNYSLILNYIIEFFIIIILKFNIF